MVCSALRASTSTVHSVMVLAEKSRLTCPRSSFSLPAALIGSPRSAFSPSTHLCESEMLGRASQLVRRRIRTKCNVTVVCDIAFSPSTHLCESEMFQIGRERVKGCEKEDSHEM